MKLECRPKSVKIQGLSISVRVIDGENRNPNKSFLIYLLSRQSLEWGLNMAHQ